MAERIILNLIKFALFVVFTIGMLFIFIWGLWMAFVTFALGTYDMRLVFWGVNSLWIGGLYIRWLLNQLNEN